MKKEPKLSWKWDYPTFVKKYNKCKDYKLRANIKFKAKLKWPKVFRDIDFNTLLPDTRIIL